MSEPFEGHAPQLIETGSMQDDEFVTRFMGDESDDLLLAIIDANVETDHADATSDLMTLTLTLFASTPTADSQWATFLRLHDHLRRIIREDPTLNGMAIEAGIGDAEAGPDFNSPRTWIDTSIVVRFEA